MNVPTGQSVRVPLGSTPTRRIKVWDLPLRLFHWTLVLAIAVAFLSSEEGSAINQWHFAAGWVAGLLLVFRLIWGFVGGEHSRFTDFIQPGRIAAHVSELLHRKIEPTLGHNPLGALAVLALLLLTAATVWTGAFGGEGAEDLHEVVAWTLLVVIAVHIAAVAIMSRLQRENLVRAMITGDKPAARHPRAADAKRPTMLGIVLAALVVVGSLYGVLSFDPQAFAPRAHDAELGAYNGQGPTADHEEHRE